MFASRNWATLEHYFCPELLEEIQCISAHLLASFGSFDSVCVDIDIRDIVIKNCSCRVHHPISHGRAHTHTVARGYG